MLFTKYNSIGCPAISGHTMKTLAQSIKGWMLESNTSDTQLTKLASCQQFWTDIFLSPGRDRPE